ncbi:MAG: type II secretion system protein, partial [Desulfobacteraceae bacterium]|nr:type II secretion system protein [Desulfobacteraceae bacterium]
MKKNKQTDKKQQGFTLLEIIIVISIMGFIAAMAWPAMGILDNNERRRETIIRLGKIRKAIIGPEGMYDEQGMRVIGGYVSDMRKFPDLFEARAEVRPDYSGNNWPLPDAGLGQGPSYALNPGFVFFRPSGYFDNKPWKWNRPFRKLFDDTVNNHDHIGGLETENEGQPRGLWTKFTEDLTFDLPGHAAPGMVEGEDWKGPYILSPINRNLKLGRHFAKSDNDYSELEPVWHNAGIHAYHETWEDGVYSPTTFELGEFYDEKEKFRLLKNNGRLTDGWDRSFRFFITKDKDRPDSKIFWIISEGSDHEGKYPTKGTCNAHNWTINANDTMGNNYNENADENKDNIVMKIYSHEFETIFLKEKIQKEQKTRQLLKNIKKALIGDSPKGNNYGFTGDTGRLPFLFRWETDKWDNEDPTFQPYTKGQPRGLWTTTPNSADPSDNISASVWGKGWRTKYCERPHGKEGNQIIIDPWEREGLFFMDTINNALLILSKGEDGKFDFGTVNPEKTEPLNFIEPVDITTYNPVAAENIDNIYTIINNYDFKPGYVAVGKITVLNAVAGTTKARFFRGGGTAISQTLAASAPLTDEDSDGSNDDWATGSFPGAPAFEYNNITIEKIITGARYLVFWNDIDNNDEIDTGENCKSIILNILVQPGTNQIPEISVNSDNFIPAP